MKRLHVVVAASLLLGLIVAMFVFAPMNQTEVRQRIFATAFKSAACQAWRSGVPAQEAAQSAYHEMLKKWDYNDPSDWRPEYSSNPDGQGGLVVTITFREPREIHFSTVCRDPTLGSGNVKGQTSDH